MDRMLRPRPAFQQLPTKKERTNKQRNANRRRGNADRELSETLKSHGIKATLKARHNLRRWRATGRNNNVFFAQYEQPVAVTRRASRVPVVAETVALPPRVVPTKLTMNAARKAFQNRQLAKRATNVSQYRVWKQTNPNTENNVFFSSKEFKPPAASTVKRWVKQGQSAAPVPLPVPVASAPVVARQVAQPVAQQTGHVEAGRKAATSQKGRAWLNDVRRAKNILDKVLAEAGSSAKSTQMEAREVASQLRRGNPAIIDKIVATKTSRGIQTTAA
jgi:hypothetical protein